MKCKIVDCYLDCKCRGMCSKHYSAFYYAGHRKQIAGYNAKRYKRDKVKISERWHRWRVSRFVPYAEYLQLAKKQRYRCAICHRKTKERLCLDHDHITRELRGLLCKSCNLGISLFGDNLKSLKRAVTYLEG